MKKIFQNLFKIILIIAISNNLHAQSVMDDLGETTSFGDFQPELVEEKIVKISPSGRVLILTNQSNGFNKGDFISLILEDQLAARAIVAKMADDVSGIKMVKIYSLALWNKLGPGATVKVLRGDDSYFGKKKTEEDNPKSTIKEEEDLFNETVLNEDEDLEEKNNRLIKPDNVISLSYGSVQSVDIDLNTTSYYILNGAWAYQVSDNVWGEIVYGQTVIRDFPNLELDTVLTSTTGRLKYTVEAPFDSYLLPYIGYQLVQATSPDAGADTSKSTTIRNRELDLVDSAGRQGLIFGVTFLKRFVPAWFMKVDIGSDMVMGGLSLEF